ncbi:MAG TPA: IS5 family transposase [Ktedonobacterales bacterium]|nr:IS5 family transposase [Ktedonobacterales bacterium]
MYRHTLTDAQWERLASLLPDERPKKRGHPYHSHRMILNGILWILATGAPWRDLPECYGPWSTVANRFYAWQHSGLWNQILTSLQQAASERGEIDWSLHFVDGTVIRAHQHAAGARKDGGDEALGWSRGGFSTKLHLRAEGQGKPMVLLLTAGQRHEQTVFEPLLEAGQVKRRGRGRPRQRPHRVVGDKGYSSRRSRQYLRRRGIRVVIPHKRNERWRGRFDRAAYRERNRVERLINRLKQFRRVATRYEKRAVNYLAMVVIAAILLWL